MTTKPKARYQTAADVFDGWRDSLFTGTGPPLYPVGDDTFANVEIGPGRVVLLGGLPGGGKSALSLQWTVDALRADPKLRAVAANVEMSAAVCLDRILSRLSGIPLSIITKRKLGAEHGERVDLGLSTLETVIDRLVFVEAPYSLENVAAVADTFRANLLIFDYLQRFRHGDHADKRGAVDELMDYLRRFSDAGVGILAISAVARTKDAKGRSSYDGNGLGLASFRESSELEYGADSCFVLVPDPNDPEVVTLRCLKHRHGEPVDVTLHFDRRIQSFSLAEPIPAMPDRGRLAASLKVLWSATPAADDDAGGGE